MYQLTQKEIVIADKYATSVMNMKLDRFAFSGSTPDQIYSRFFIGTLGELLFKQFLDEHKIEYTLSERIPGERDHGDFILKDGRIIDVKTYIKPYHTCTMIPDGKIGEIKDIIVSVMLNPRTMEGYIIGWCSDEAFVDCKDFGHGLTYYVEHKNLDPIQTLFDLKI